MPDPLKPLVRMTRSLGARESDYVILGEGNTSARIDEGSFWITASGTSLGLVDDGSFVRVDMGRALAMLEAGELTDDEVREALIASRVTGAGGKPRGTSAKKPGKRGADLKRPSVETAVHAVLLTLPGVKFVGHTHPTWVNMLTCSARFADLVSGRVFPDEIVLCGPASVAVPYVDPGLPLAREIRARVDEFVKSFRTSPKVLLMQNHGMVALGQTPEEVENITAMTVKAARILVGTLAAGGPNFLSGHDVERIQTRADEHYRRRVIAEQSAKARATGRRS